MIIGNSIKMVLLSMTEFYPTTKLIIGLGVPPTPFLLDEALFSFLNLFKFFLILPVNLPKIL